MASRDELVTELADLRAQVGELNEQYAGEAMPDEAREQWNTTNERIDTLTATIEELDARMERVAQLAGEDRSTERPELFQTRRPGRTHDNDIYDLAAVRRDARSLDDENDKLRDHAMRSVDTARFPHPYADKAEVKEHIERLLDHDGAEGEIRRRILQTGSPTYQRAFGKWLANGGTTAGFSGDEQRAFITTTTGIPIPYTLDPTLIHTSNFSVNPFRTISRVVTITGSNQWLGATSGAITAAYATEGAEASDNTPTLTQPSATVVRAQAFVPFSMESAEDWPSLQREMASLFADAKDDLEATKFFSGTGTVEPQGLSQLGTPRRVQTAGTAAFVVGDVYNTESNLAPRWRPRASFVLNRAQANRIRQFDTAGGAQLWTDNLRVGLPNNVPTGGQLGNALLGYPAYELSTAGTSIASGSSILYFGDFSRGFIIVDRIGMDVTFVPMMFGTANNYPSGQQGLYARWRNTSILLGGTASTSFVYLAAL